MTDPIPQIEASLRRFARRERTLMAVRAACASTVVVLAGWLGGVVLLNYGVRPTAAAAGVLGAAALGLGAWQLRGVRAAAELRRQAARVEAVTPAFQGELLTVLDRTARPLGSPALVQRMAKRVVEPLHAVPPARVVPAGPATRWALAVAFAAVLLALSNLLAIGPAAVLSAFRAVSAAAKEPPVDEGPRALVGDITLRYLYPTYTGLSPLEVPNSNGDIHAPPGTMVEVRARAERAWDSVTLTSYGQPGPAEIDASRGLRSSLVVRVPVGDEPATWRFQFSGTSGSMYSPDYRIVVDPDLAPQVTLDVASARMRAALDQPLGVAWHVHDDYGVRRVVVEIREGSSTREVEVRAPLNAPRDVDDTLLLTPKALGLGPGSSVQLRLKAWDNDDVTGSKAGWSAPVQLVVEGAQGDSAKMMPARRELRDALVLVLADFLLDASPPIQSPAEGEGWASRANARYERVDNLLAATWSDGQGGLADESALRELDAKRRVLLSTLRGLPGSGRLADGDRDAVVEAQAAHVEALEGAILLFDTMIQRAAMKLVSEVAADMAAEAEEMRDDFPKVDKENAAQALARLDQLARMLKALSEAAAQMGEGALAEFTNQGVAQLSDMLAEARKAIEEGRYDDAKAMMDRLAEGMRQLADGLEDQQKRQADSSTAVADAMKKLDKDLEALQADQQALRERTEAAREEHGASMDEALAVWKEIEERAQSASRGAGAVVVASGPLGGGMFRSASDVRAEVDGLLDAARARDVERTRSRAESTLREVQGMNSMLKWLGRDPSRSAAPAVEAGLPPIQADAKRILALLDKLQRQQASPELQRALEQLADQQQQINERAEQVSKDAQGVARSLPMKAPGLQKGAEQAAEESGRATQAMRDGDPMSAAGGQQATEDGIQEARDALKQAEQTMQSMAKGSGQGGASGDGEPGEDQSGNGQGPPMGEMTLPAPEQFQTPEAYRRALMEGMQGEVPEQYKSSNLRYYEELVRQ